MTADLAALAQEAHEKTCPHFQATRGNVDKLDHGLGGGRAVAVNSVIGPASAVAEAERDRIRERIGDVKADQRKRRYLGSIVSFGWQPGEDGGPCQRS